MKKKNIRVIIFAVVCIALLVGAFWWVNHSREASVEDTVNLTEVQKVITKDLDKNYPETPREVVKLYNRIISCFYGEKYSEDELYSLGEQARKLFDAELLENNPEDAYFDALKADIAEYKEKSKTIASTSVCDSNDVKFQKIDGDECAYVTASYFINENKQYSRTYQTYVLRKDEDGRWKILVFYQTEGESSENE